jgi:hypothetical protein
MDREDTAMIGRVYRWRDAYWRVIGCSRPLADDTGSLVWLERVGRDGPTEQWVPHVSGERVCRPFRGLRRADAA